MSALQAFRGHDRLGWASVLHRVMAEGGIDRFRHTCRFGPFRCEFQASGVTLRFQVLSTTNCRARPRRRANERQERHDAENEDRSGRKKDSGPQFRILLRSARPRRPMAECGQTQICISYRDPYGAGMDTNFKRPVTAICRSWTELPWSGDPGPAETFRG